MVGFRSPFLWIGENLNYTERMQWNKKMLKISISACADYSIHVKNASQISILFIPGVPNLFPSLSPQTLKFISRVTLTVYQIETHTIFLHVYYN